jgi:hypothetical protein
MPLTMRPTGLASPAYAARATAKEAATTASTSSSQFVPISLPALSRSQHWPASQNLTIRLGAGRSKCVGPIVATPSCSTAPRLPGPLQERKTRDQHKLQTLRRTMRGIVEDVLWEGGVLTTDEIYRGVKARHAQLGQLLAPRWQEEVQRILEAQCISHEARTRPIGRLQI